MTSKIKFSLGTAIVASTIAFAMHSEGTSNLRSIEQNQLNASAIASITPTAKDEVTLSNAPAVNEQVDESSAKVQLALLLDTSGSMSGLIEQAKSQIWNIVNELVSATKDGTNPTFEIALYQYGNSGLNVRDHYVQQIYPFTSNIDEVNQALFDLRTNGGEEYCGAVIKNSLSKLTWSDNPDDLKIIYIAGNEPFTQGPVYFETQCSIAKDQNITINTIFCGDHQTGINGSWKRGAILTNGEYFTINHDHTIAQIASPYDEKLSQLNLELNQCMVYHGEIGQAGYYLNATQDSLSWSQGLSSYNSRNKFKASNSYGGQWDLTTLSKEELAKFVSDNDVSEYSDNVKSESKEAVLENIELLQQKKEQIKLEITQNMSLRDRYVIEQEKLNQALGKDNSLGASIIRSIQSQGKKRGFIFGGDKH